jgi:hypothetical protein
MIDMDEHKIIELKKLRAEVKAELDRLDASIRTRPEPLGLMLRIFFTRRCASRLHG